MTRNVKKAVSLDGKIAWLERWGGVALCAATIAFVIFFASAAITYLFDIDFETWPQHVIGISFVIFVISFVAMIGMGTDIAKLDKQKAATEPKDNVR